MALTGAAWRVPTGRTEGYRAPYPPDNFFQNWSLSANWIERGPPIW
jgi:hypothetical protein